MLQNAPLTGNKDSDIVVIEYGAFECHYCQVHHENNTINTLITNHNLASTMKQFPLRDPISSEGALCVLDLKGEKAFFEYIDKVYTTKDPSKANITTVATSLGIKETNFSECLSSGKFKKQVTLENQTGRSMFKISGTPGTVLLNRTNGKFVTVSGAQGIDAFEQALEQLKNS